jgi:hypothetical protein
MATTLPSAALRLAEAELAYHRLLLGQSAVEVRDQNNEAVVYSRADATRLKAYIEALRMEVAGKPPTRGPMGVWL